MLNGSQQSVLLLWQQVNTSLSAYDKLIKAFSSAEDALNASVEDWKRLTLHKTHLQRHHDQQASDEFLQKIHRDLQKGSYQLIFAGEENFPHQLEQLFDPPPLLFVRGNVARLQEAQIAIVGSRKPTPHAQKISFDMAQYLAQSGYIITSGLAQGVDYQAHVGALTQSHELLTGRTVGVMGTGIDVCYPRQHQPLFKQIIDEGGCIISELLPQTVANKHTFPRRNRIVAGLSLATVVTEATIQSGSLITARLTSEQGKQVFAIPSHIDNHNAEGCHHLIREGATLIYHPNQVLEDIRYQNSQSTSLHNMLATDDGLVVDNELPRTTDLTDQQDVHSLVITAQSSNTPSTATLPLANSDIPSHLTQLFEQIDWKGADVDTLIINLKIDTQTLLSQLMELELMGLINQQGGRYVRI